MTRKRTASCYTGRARVR